MPDEEQPDFVAEEVPPPAEVLGGLDAAQMEVVAAMRTESYSGPLPPPQVLAAYEDVLPGGARRIFERFEVQSDHRIDIEMRVVDSGNAAQTRAQWLAFFLLLSLIGLAAYAASLGQSVAAVLIAPSTLTGGASVFIIGKRAQARDLESHGE